MRRKGGAVDVIVWQTPTARLLPRLLAGRRAGPVFLTDRAACIPLPGSDLDPDSGRARLSYRRAAERFTQTTATLPGGPWTLHQLRHSALTHAAEAGAPTSTLLAYSGHTSVASLARYARVSPGRPRPLAGNPRPRRQTPLTLLGLGLDETVMLVMTSRPFGRASTSALVDDEIGPSTARLSGSRRNLIQDCAVSEQRESGPGRRPQWRGDRKAVLVRMPVEVAESLLRSARLRELSVSEHAAQLLADALRDATDATDAA